MAFSPGFTDWRLQVHACSLPDQKRNQQRSSPVDGRPPNNSHTTIFVTKSANRWQVVCRMGVTGEYAHCRDAIAYALGLAARLPAHQVLLQNSRGQYDRLWPLPANLPPGANPPNAGAPTSERIASLLSRFSPVPLQNQHSSEETGIP